MTPSGRGENVLVVDDHEDVRAVIAGVLRTAGYRVHEAASAADADAQAMEVEGPLHLLVTDVVLGSEGGRALAERLMRTQPRLRVLFVSGYARSDLLDASGALSPGTAFLPKPFTPHALRRKVREVLDGPQAGDAS